VFTPSNASWLNWIECEFTALRYFTLDGSDYASNIAHEAAIAGYVRWRHKHALPKRRFAVDSKIRRPDYLPSVACRGTGRIIVLSNCGDRARYGVCYSQSVCHAGYGAARRARSIRSRRWTRHSRC
jgi:hypothetical protein